ncbi:hypothetical protein FVEN_g9516 [Fusarium venenatum]|uniref:CFEM domain-containing protein n=1 Tax=Fusarium venenatum TaxID=56646 RepID=A0A2L2TRE2_9HYPO|nr:uncharacterized protein FVRRES_04209 [Fusarium venenatum]KAG8352350.1 hypothetical protein FVEN_g9516 [Fusarium venenatum]CEI67697.1 unnamed protein product [Fusarium venenatum]
MKLLPGIIACLIALPLAFATLDNEASAIISTLPTCAAKCLVTNVLASTCDLDDYHCTCENEPLQHELEKCILASCTIKEALFTKNATSVLCGAPVRDVQPSFKRINDVMGIMSGIFVILRFGTKIMYRVPMGLDDLFIMITMILSGFCMCINAFGAAPSGIGTDIWTLTPQQITDFARWFWTLVLTYFILQTTMKLSLLFFFLRIFPSRGVRKLLWAAVVFISLNGTIFALVAVFQCQPISHFWHSWDGEHTGRCASVNGVAWSNGAVNIASDFWILGIPLSQLSKLNLDWRKKVGVGMMFGVGTFVTAVSIFRLYACIVAGISQTNNKSWDYLAMAQWSTVEVNVGIWCACMPTMRVLLMRLSGQSKRYISYGSHKSGQDSSREDPNRPRTKTYPLERGSGSSASATAVKGSRGRMQSSGITCDTIVEVEFGAHDDETHLVEMKKFDHSKSALTLSQSEDSV